MFGSIGFRTTVYDILGYFIPGAIGLFVVWLSVWAGLGRGFAWGLVGALNEASVVGCVMIAVVVYITGHLINSLSSWLLERGLLAKYFRSQADWVGRLEYESEKGQGKKQAHAKRTLDSYELLFGYRPENKDWLFVTGYIDEFMPGASATALRFQAFYGMGRSVALLCFLATIPVSVILTKHGWMVRWCLSGGLVVAGILFLNQYLRFVRNHRDFLAGIPLLVEYRQRNRITSTDAEEI